MSEFYQYSKRDIATCQGGAGQVARASDTSLSVENARALYMRPKLIHSGPMVHWTTQQPEPNAWPWMHLGVDSEKNTLLDQCSLLTQHAKGVIDVTLMIVVATAAAPPETSGDLTENISSIPITFTALFKQYTNGNVAPTTIYTVTDNARYPGYPCSGVPNVPILNNIFHGWRFREVAFYDKNRQVWGGILTGATTSRRPAQLYPQDIPLLFPVRLAIPFDVIDYEESFPVVIEIRADFDSTDPDGIRWSDSIPNENIYRGNRDFIRVFNVSSAMRERGTL